MEKTIEQKKSLLLFIPKEMKRKLKERAASQEMTLNNLVMAILKSYVDSLNPKKQ